MAVYLFALGAALLFGLGSVVQQRVASVAPPGKSLRPALLWWLVRQPVWLVGVGTAVVGNVLSGAALGLGSVALVQPLLVSRLLFAIPLSAVWVRQRLALRDWVGMLATAGGLGVFLAVGRPRQGADAAPSVLQWLLVIAVIVALTGVLVFVARRLSPAREAPMLGAGAGMMFALQSGFTHTAVGGFLAGGLAGILLNWTTYAVAATAILGTLLAQSAYEMAPLAASYPALAAVEPLAGIGIAVGILGTTLAYSALSLGIFVVALAVMTFGIYLLATSDLVTAQRKTMAQRRAADVVADLERDLAHDLDRLESTVTWLERCRRPGATPPREPAVETRLQRADTLLECIGAALDRLAQADRQAEADIDRSAAPAGTPTGRPAPEAQQAALARYQEDNRKREAALRARVEELQARTGTQRELIAAERRRR